MTIKFAREFLHDIWDEAAPLLELHYEEIAHYKDIALKPDRARYMVAEDAGGVRAYTARDDNRLVGYQVFFVARNIHYSDSLQAMQDVLYLSREHRGRMIGFKFISWCDEQLRAEGVQAVMQHTKAKHNFGPMLERIGYELMDLVHVRRLN